MVRLKVQHGDIVLEVEAMNPNELADVVNRATKKFLTRTALGNVSDSF